MRERFLRALEWEPTPGAPASLILEQHTALVGAMLEEWPLSPALTERCLRAMWRDLQPARPPLALDRVERDLEPVDRRPCGTEAAHSRHRRNGETPCEACVEAHNAYNRERRRASL